MVGLREYFRTRTFEFAEVESKAVASSFRAFVTSTRQPSLLKEEYANIYVSLESDLRNIYNLAKGDERLMAAWKILLTSVEVSSQTIGTILGRELKIGRPTYWTYDYRPEVLFSPASVIDSHTSYYNHNRSHTRVYSLSLYPSIRKGLVELFYGNSFLTPEVLKTLPESGSYLIEDFEGGIAQELSFLSGLAMTGSIASASGVVTAARLKSIKKQWEFRNYCSPFPEKDIDRMEQILNAYYLFHSAGKKRKEDGLSSPDKFGNFVLNIFPTQLTGTRLTSFLPAFKGFTKSWAGDVNTKVFTTIVTELLLPSANGWMSMSNLKMRYLCAPLVRKWSADNYNTLFTSSARGKHTLQRRDDSGASLAFLLQPIDWFNEIDFPFLISWIRFLCGAGLIALAIKKGWENDESQEKALQGIDYIRMTPLGKYVFGFDKKYEVKRASFTSDIEVDARNGILTINSSGSPYAIFLSQICEPISSTRFHLTAKGLIKGCDNVEIVRNRISNLESLLDKKDKESLKHIFEEVERRVNCKVPIDKEYMLLKLSPNLPALVELIMNNKTIRSKVVLAEQSMLMVEKTFYPRFKQICQENGFLFE
ncbi:MAG: hypothetical protein K2H76_06270 [Muribaculaceae bacterium]|nr:hypothetical protein [Muribaculaceae bacterium]